MNHIWNRTAAKFALTVLLLMAVAGIQKVYAAGSMDVSIEIPVRHVIHGEADKSRQPCRLVLTPRSPGAPMPSGTVGGQKQITTNRTETVSFGEITYNAPDVYRYTVTKESDDVKYDVQVIILNDGTGKVVAGKRGSMEKNEIYIEESYPGQIKKNKTTKNEPATGEEGVLPWMATAASAALAGVLLLAGSWRRGRNLSWLLLMGACLIAMPVQSHAAVTPVVSIDRDLVVTEQNPNPVVTGRVDPADGQTVVLRASEGGRILSRVKVDNTGKGAPFQLKVPASSLIRGKTVTLFVNSMYSGRTGRSNAAAVSVLWEPKEAPAPSTAARESSSVSTVKKNSAVSSPRKTDGKSTKKKAKKNAEKKKLKIIVRSRQTGSLLARPFSLRVRVSSGKVSYRSSRKRVATVDSHGKIHPRSIGRTKITIRVRDKKLGLKAKKTVVVVIRKPTAEEGRKAAVEWAVRIANDNSFSYGAGRTAHHNGCYFCGTNGGKMRTGGSRYRKTYCCNPFIHAAYAHGAKDPAMLRACRHKNAIAMTRESFLSKGCWRSLGKPSFSRLIPGDVFVSRGHVWMYCGGNKLVESTSLGGGSRSWSADTIRVRSGAKNRYHRCRFVMRYTGYSR